MATPTFLAGFCTVLASILAYGTTQTHLLYSSGLPACAEASCSSASPHSGIGGALGSGKHAGHRIDGKHVARGGQRQQAPDQPAPGAGRRPRANRSPGGPARHNAARRWHPGGSQGPRVVVVYRTQKRSSGQFIAAVTITNRGKAVLTGWQLGMRYRQATISDMWGARWIPADPRSRAGLAAAPVNQRPLRPGMSARFVFLAHGAAGPPGGCAFDGYRCTFLGHAPPAPGKPHDPGPHQGHAHNPGRTHGHHPGQARGRNPGSAYAQKPGSHGVQLTAWVHPTGAKPGHAEGHPGTKVRPHATGHSYTKGDSRARGRSRAPGQSHAKRRAQTASRCARSPVPAAGRAHSRDRVHAGLGGRLPAGARRTCRPRSRVRVNT